MSLLLRMIPLTFFIPSSFAFLMPWQHMRLLKLLDSRNEDNVYLRYNFEQQHHQQQHQQEYFKLPRLYLGNSTSLAPGLSLQLSAEQDHYVCRVLRCRPGQLLRIFNGRDGEFLAAVVESTGDDNRGTGKDNRESQREPKRQLRQRSKRLQQNNVILKISNDSTALIRVQMKSEVDKSGPQSHFSRIKTRLFLAAIKPKSMRFAVEKATELGISSIQPIISERTQLPSSSLSSTSIFDAEKMRAVSVEAAEQCERLTVPSIEPVRQLSEAVLSLLKSPSISKQESGIFGEIDESESESVIGQEIRHYGSILPREILFVCEERSLTAQPALVAMKEVLSELAAISTVPIAVTFLVGPEGGWAPGELDAFLNIIPTEQSAVDVRRISLGENVLRAETAAVATVACWCFAMECFGDKR